MPEGTPESSGTSPLPSCHIPALLALPNRCPTHIRTNLSHSPDRSSKRWGVRAQPLPPCHHGLLGTGPKCRLLRSLPGPCGLLSETAGRPSYFKIRLAGMKAPGTQ